MMNGKHRARWISELISEAQRLHKKARGCPEDALLTQALEKLATARDMALDDKSEGSDNEH
jgi:hypothetical protein